jgi:uncharacterized C2H2 Zn-finger protein
MTVAAHDPRPNGPFEDIGTFCYYCQKEFTTSKRLNKHINKVHVHTYSWWAIRGDVVGRKKKGETP